MAYENVLTPNIVRRPPKFLTRGRRKLHSSQVATPARYSVRVIQLPLALGMAMEELERVCCIRGYHVYKEVWEAAVGKTLMCEREPRNALDRYAVAVIKTETIIGHLPQKLSRVCSPFLRRGGTIDCTVTGTRRHSVDLPQGRPWLHVLFSDRNILAVLIII